MNKLLIIDDDELVANIYRNKFNVAGFQAEVALDGEQGLAILEELKPDVIVVDLVLPKMSGVDVIKSIRANPNFAGTPVIVFSNTYLTNHIQDAWKAGATKCLSKSNCTPKQLIEVIRGSAGQQHKPAPLPAAAEKPQTAPVPGPVVIDPEVCAAFLGSLSASVSILRANILTLSKAAGEAEQANQLKELHRRVHTLTGNASIAGMKVIARFGDAFEALLQELLDRPGEFNASTRRTIANSVDFLGWLFMHGIDPRKQESANGRALIVDDESISRRAVALALEKIQFTSTTVEDPAFALNMAPQNRFDLICLDVDMPGINGFELCSKLRRTSAHKSTPVVFVTGLADFDSRANSTISGGNDLIAKPFLSMELAVKALIHVTRSNLTG